jgi:uncharacterized protein YcfJ
VPRSPRHILYRRPRRIGKPINVQRDRRQFLNCGTIPLGALIGGALGQAMGLRSAMWEMTAAVAVAPLVLLIGPIRKSRDLPVQPCEGGMASQESGIAPDRYQRHLA